MQFFLDLFREYRESNDRRDGSFLVFSMVGVLSLLIFGFVNFGLGKYLVGIGELLVSLATFLNFIFVYKKSKDLGIGFMILLMNILLFVLFISRGIANTGVLWLFVYPVIVFFLNQRRRGWFYILITLLLTWATSYAQQVGLYDFGHTAGFIFQTSLIYLILSFMIYGFARSIDQAESRLIATSKEFESMASVETMQRKIFEETSKNLSVQTDKLEDTKEAILNILDDVDEEKRRAIDLAIDLEKFRLAVENTSDQIVISDPEGTVLFANQAIKSITGYSVEEAKGSKAGKLWGGLMEKAFYEKMWKTIKIDKKTFAGEITNKRKNGEHYVASVNISPVLSQSGEIRFFVSVERDITKAKEIDKMKTEFISLASHQLRTPLSAMKWFLEMLLAGDMGKLSKDQLTAVENINSSNERMIELVNSLLNISRIESGRIIIEPEKVDIKELIDSITMELKQKFEDKKQTYTVTIKTTKPEFIADKKLIRNALMNLLTNANKYTPDSGKIDVRVFDKKDNLLIEVEDNGYGIPEKDHAHVFDKFYRGGNIIKQVTDGNGLGLYLVKSVIDSSGGKISFVSEEGKGTKFSILLPRKGVKAKAGQVRLDG